MLAVRGVTGLTGEFGHWCNDWPVCCAAGSAAGILWVLGQVVALLLRCCRSMDP
jgi:hypothetical protein